MKRFLRRLRKIDLSVLLALGLVIFTLVSIWTLKIYQEHESPLAPEKETERKVEISPPVKFTSQESLWLSSSESFSLDIIPTRKVSALVYRFDILFDPKILSVEKISIGNFFEDPVILRKEIDNEAGNIYFSAGVTPEEINTSGEPKNRNLLATLLFKVKPLTDQQKTQETLISFGGKTLIISKKAEFENLNQILKPIKVVVTKEQGE